MDGLHVLEYSMQPSEQCYHPKVVGDNYKETCLSCGKVEWHDTE